MRLRITQRALIAVAMIGALLLATGCNSPTSPPAATIGSDTVAVDAVLRESKALAAVPEDPYGFQGEVNGSLNSEMVSSVLTQRIRGVIYEQWAQRSGLSADEATLDAARTQLGALVNELPGDVADDIVRRSALGQVVQKYVTSAQWWTDADIERYHELTKRQVCLRHILVATEAEAEDVMDELKAGADFGELAQKVSMDTTTGADGGNIGCQPSNVFVESFRDAIDGAESGEVVGPTASPGGFHVILVEEAEHDVSFDETRDAIESLFASPDASGWAEFVMKTTKVSVYPRFGTWDQLNLQVLPPEGARPASSSDVFSAS